MAAINIVLKAVDQYSSTITGLNQGFDLVGKAIGGLQAIADATWQAIKAGADLAMQGVQKAIELAVKGGNFSEMSRQFNIVAASFNVDGRRIIESLNDITLNMISMTDAVRLAGKGVTVGFNESELEKIFTFVKRRTEQTGEDFTQMAETIITSVAKGRYSTLADFGLIIEKGATMEKAVRTIAEATKAYGNAGFNTADNINALNNQQEKFFTKIGEAINDSKEWEKLFTNLTKYVVDFVKEFDYRQVTFFFETVGKSIEAFSEIINTVGLKGWIRGLVNDWAKEIDTFKKDWGALFKFLYEQIRDFAQFQRENPLFSQKILGLNPEIWTQVEVSLGKLGVSLAADRKKIFEQTRKYSEDEINAISKNAEKQMETFNKQNDAIRKQQQRAVVESLKATIEAEKKLQQERAAEEAAEKRKAAEERTRQILESRKNEKQLEEVRSAEELERIRNFLKDKRNLENNALSSLQQSFQGTFNAILADAKLFTDDAEKLLNDWSKSVDDIFSDFDELETELNQPTQGIIEQQSQPVQQSGIQDTLAAANWPAEFAAMGEFMFKWVLSVASGSSLPMAVTTTP